MELDQRQGEEDTNVWQLYYTAEGHAYYHNHLTGESRWAEASELEGSTPSEYASGSSSWNSEDEDRFQTYLLTPEGQRALQTEELQAEQILAQRRKRLERLGSGFSLTPRSPKELAEAYSDMEELSDGDGDEDRDAALYDRPTGTQQQQASTPYAVKASHQRSASNSSLYQNGSVPIVDSSIHTPRPIPPQYSDPRQQFHPLLDARYLSQPFEQPEYYDARSPKSRGRKPSGKHRHRDRRRSQRHPPSFKYSNHFHDGADGSDLDTDDESASGSDAEEEEQEEEDEEDLKEILAIDESFAKVYNMFAVTGAALSACTAHASKWMYESAAAIMSAVYSRAVEELEKLAASEQQQQRQSRGKHRSRPQVALA